MKDIFAVYKPVGPTSHDVVERIRKITGVKKVGHAGTLDPLAKGVLVVGIGREATKKLHEVVEKEKEYVAKIRLGMTSTTDDEEGEKKKVEMRNEKKPRRDEVKQVLRGFIGSILQTPPIFSAIKVRGTEAYKLARRGREVRLESRPALIKSIEILGYRWPYLTLRVVTGPGVYVRALARDVGKKLKTGGYLAALERTRVGEFKKEHAVRLGELEAILKKERARP